MIRHVIFDIGQVLIDVLLTEFLEKFAAAFQVDPSVIISNSQNGAHIDFMTGKVSGEEFYQRTTQSFNHSLPLEDFKNLWIQMLGEQKDDTARIVKLLSEKNYNLSLLSNIDPWHFEYCEQNYPVLKAFNRKFVSFKLKLKKPDPEIFIKVASELKSDPQDCLLIDDKLENVDSAKKVGFQAVQFIDVGQLREWLKKRGIL